MKKFNSVLPQTLLRNELCRLLDVNFSVFIELFSLGLYFPSNTMILSYNFNQKSTHLSFNSQ